MTFTPASANTPDQRAQALQGWFAAQLPALGGGTMESLRAISGDASFRRYFRGTSAGRSWILVDAPPQHENSQAFIEIAGLLTAGGVNVPRVLACDTGLGFLCLGDFGDQLLWNELDAAQRSAAPLPQAEALYQSAFDQLLRIQRCAAASLPRYDEALLLREMRLFTEWFCGGLMRLELDAAEQALLESAYSFLVTEALSQPRVFVHRDYHSRNLMYRPGKAPGVLDFQDAVLGPVSYDLVSLLKDCYIAWPRGQVNAWALAWHAQAQARDIARELDAQQFLRAFDLMGAQRHLKVLGIFSRLWLRDGKPAYLRDLPLTLHYLLAVVEEHRRLEPLHHWLHARVLPAFDSVLQQAIGSSGGKGGMPA